MRKTEDGFWERPEDWSKRKHLILRYYLKSAVGKLRSVSPDRRVVILDGFAGRGEYKDGSPGSPVHMGNLAWDCAQWRDPLHLRIINVEPNPSTYTALQAHTQAWVDEGVMLNLNTTFRKALPLALTDSGFSPLYAILDPFRPKDLLFEDYLPLLRRSAVTETFVVLHTPRIYRMIRAVEAGEQQEHVMASVSTLNSVFGGSRWRELIEREAFTSADVAACYRDELAARYSQAHYSMIHPVMARYEVNLKYHILFISRHKDGVKLMNDAFCREAHDAYSTSNNNNQLSLFDQDAETSVEVKGPTIEQSVFQRNALLEAELESIGCETPLKEWVREELAFEILTRRFGEFYQTDYRQAIDRLVHQGRLHPMKNARRTKAGKWITNERSTMSFV